MKDRGILLDVCPRKCGGCLDSDHHWVDDFDVKGVPTQKCKHCPATREYPDEN
ncbi:hypothetical protein LCGC14_0376580 [marine sediment metagenome]|uniref:Uncharacterized protein n=1 Tax=marine sediment metagenome TaxID=412755 RepID=A0A0F9TLL8_9ZZZZ